MTEFIKMHRKIGKVNAYYWESDFDACRPTLIMIHGFRGDHHGMLKIAEKLGRKYNLFIPDLPGFGETQHIAGEKHNLELYIEFLRSFIKSLKLEEKPNLLAHSFGTTIVSAYAAKYGGEANKIVLLSPIAARPLPLILSPAAKPVFDLLRAMPDKLGRAFTANKLTTDFMSRTLTKTNDRALRRWIVAEHRRFFGGFTSHRAMMEAMQASNKHHVAEFAHAIANQTLIIAGNKDLIGKSKQQAKLVQVLPNSKVEVIKNVGHLTHYETPGEVATHVLKFI
ncbi:MAG: alpha/beta hydrolase [Candidatus Nomurabacteria bacterium]|jgi:pimeloyl-ACP methyl ester carboxylesterase|nr:alpha/beta hydrolase [Candidatus Nomurabacteria bacterium]